MGSGDWLKTIISRKKTKQDRLKQLKGSNSEQPNGVQLGDHSDNYSTKLHSRVSSITPGDGITVEEIAATRIQTAFRRFKAQRTLRSLKGVKRLQVLSEGHSLKKQASATMNHIQSWSRIQAEVRARRASMVTEGRMKQKRLENQLKLEAKLHDIEVEWCGGSETMEEIHSRIQQREEAAVKRERAMAYAFSHQWRANSGLFHGPATFDVGNGSWSWTERWIAARPWETRIAVQAISSGKTPTKILDSFAKSISSSVQKASSAGKPAPVDGKGPLKRESQPADENTVSQKPNSKPTAASQTKTWNAKTKLEGKLPTKATDIAG